MQCFFESKPESVGQARDFVAQALAGRGLTAAVEDIRLCVSELASNALLHGTAPGRGFLVRLTIDDEVVRLEVHDSCRRRPEIRQPTALETSGRGLLLVTEFADDWGVEDRQPLGKVVWACFKAASESGRVDPEWVRAEPPLWRPEPGPGAGS